jgi:hypothetical protein
VNEHLPEYGDSFKQLTVQVIPETPSRLHVKISPAGQQRWEVPERVVPRFVLLSAFSSAVAGLTQQCSTIHCGRPCCEMQAEPEAAPADLPGTSPLRQFLPLCSWKGVMLASMRHCVVAGHVCLLRCADAGLVQLLA